MDRDAEPQIGRALRIHTHRGAVLAGLGGGIEHDLDQPPVRHPALQPDVGAGEGGALGIFQRDDVVAELSALVPRRAHSHVHIAKGRSRRRWPG
jgi:hypothetical protein